MRRRAETAAGRDRLSHVVDREQQLFAKDHKRSATREEVENLLEKVESLLDSSVEAEAIQRAIHRVRRKHGIESGSRNPVVDFSSLMSELAALKDALRIERDEEAQRSASHRQSELDTGPADHGEERRTEESYESGS